jgi:hypothetical protein
MKEETGRDISVFLCQSSFGRGDRLWGVGASRIRMGVVGSGGFRRCAWEAEVPMHRDSCEGRHWEGRGWAAVRNGCDKEMWPPGRDGG